MKTKIYILALLILMGVSCKKDFLTRTPQDTLLDDNYWSSEKNLRIFAYGFYQIYFTGYGNGWAWGKYFFQGQPFTDDFGPTNPVQFLKIIPNTSGNWSFTNVRKANIMLNRVPRVPGLDEAGVKHWTGIARFFRAMAYYELVKIYGDVPWYGDVLDINDDEELYKPRDSRTLVMDSVMADFKYAAENVRATDGDKGLNVTKWVVMAYMSRAMLFEGTWQKYHFANAAKSKEYLEAARWAANEIITGGGYSFSHLYRESFNSLELAFNKEMIMYRRYAPGMLTHALNSYVNREGQTGPNKGLIESYLCTDGLPVTQSGVYQGDKTITQVMASRDSRMFGTFNMELRPNGSYGRSNLLGVSTTGYCTLKFLNEDIKDTQDGLSNVNPTHAPVIRLGEVMMNYAEALVEMGELTQADLDKSINVVRARPGGNLPPLQIINGKPAVNGANYTDPTRDPTVDDMIWEIRRERRVELTMEGFRMDDLRRWKKLEYSDTKKYPDINKGAWIKRSEWLKPDGVASWLKDVTLEGGGAEGYIIPAPSAAAQREFKDDKVYLDPLPLDQIKLYKDKGVTLEQNPGWTQ